MPLSGVPSADAALRAIEQRVPSAAIERGFGTLSHVGVGAGAEASELLTLLAELETPPSLLIATPLRVTALLPLEALALAERGLHARVAA